MTSGLRAAVYGALLVGAVGLGCNLKSCSCKGLAGKTAQQQRAFSDVEMLSEGVEPRVELRVARWNGFKYRVVLESSGSLALEGQPAPFGPTLVMTLDHEVLRGSTEPILVRHDAGASTQIEERIEERVMLESLVVKPESGPPEVVEAWNRGLASFRGSSMRQQITASAGIALLKSELLGGNKPPEHMLAALDASLESQRHFPFRLPSTAVGVGAKWRFREKVNLNGVIAQQIADMTLEAVDGNTAVVGILLRQEAPRQAVPHPLVPGQLATLEQFRGDGEGELVVDRLTAIPLRGRLVGASRLTLSGEVAGQHGTATLVGANVIVARAAALGDPDSAAP